MQELGRENVHSDSGAGRQRYALKGERQLSQARRKKMLQRKNGMKIRTTMNVVPRVEVDRWCVIWQNPSLSVICGGN